jgi:hypothetical protein
MEQSKVDEIVKEVKQELEGKKELRATLSDYMKDWNQFAKPVLIELARAREEQEKFPVAADMKNLAAERRMEIVNERIRRSAGIGKKNTEFDEYLIDSDVLTALSKAEFRVTPEQIITRDDDGAKVIARKYRVQWE